MAKHYVGERGSYFVLDTGIDLTDITTQHVSYNKPGGTAGTWVATLYNSYSELTALIGTYLIRYLLAGTDFSTSGEWEFQAVVANTAGTWYGENVKQTIYNQFE